jgi:osmotically-inducible protein OsmY
MGKNSTLESSFTPEPDRGFGKADRLDHAYGDSYDASLASDHAGKGPKGYKRSDDRIKDDIAGIFTRHHELDASEIEIEVRDGDVVLKGEVPLRTMRYLAENLAEDIYGVMNLDNQIRVQKNQ